MFGCRLSKREEKRTHVRNCPRRHATFLGCSSDARSKQQRCLGVARRSPEMAQQSMPQRIGVTANPTRVDCDMGVVPFDRPKIDVWARSRRRCGYDPGSQTHRNQIDDSRREYLIMRIFSRLDNIDTQHAAPLAPVKIARPKQRHRTKRRHTDFFLAEWRVFLGNRGNEPFVPEEFAFMRRLVRYAGQWRNDHVEPMPIKCSAQHVWSTLHEPQANQRRLGREVRYPHAEASFEQARAESDRQCSTAASRHVRRIDYLSVDCIKDPAGARQDRLTDRGEREWRTPPSREEVAAIDILQPAYGLADGGLTAPEPPCRLGETPRLDDVQEHGKLMKLRMRPPCVDVVMHNLCSGREIGLNRHFCVRPRASNTSISSANVDSEAR